MKYGELQLGQIEAIVNKLGGMRGVKRFLSGETVVRAMEQTFAVWKTIKLGTGLRTADEFRRALKSSGFHISDWASDTLGKPAFSAVSNETELDLVVVSVAELGFKNGATCRDTYKRAQKLGLELCPAEVGPQLRLQYKDQPMGEWLLIGMEPVAASVGDVHVFYVGRNDGGLWLHSADGSPFWRAGHRWVFVRPRK